MRCVRRRNDATERSRTSSAVSAVTSVRRPRCFGAPARGALGAAAGRAGAPPMPRRDRTAVVVLGLGRERARRPAWRRISAARLLPRRRSASWRLRRPCAWFLRRGGGARLRSRLRASAASRSVRSIDIALLADLRLFLGDLALFGLAHLRVAERMGARGSALPRSACAARRRTPSARRRAAWRRRRWRGAALRRRAATTPPRRMAGCGGAAPRRRAWLASPGPTRRFTFSTTTGLRAAMAEALAHNARLGARLQRQRRLRADAQFLAGTFRISSHSHPILNLRIDTFQT